MKKAEQIKFPYRGYWTDGDRTNFPSSPIRRHEASRAMGLSFHSWGENCTAFAPASGRVDMVTDAPKPPRSQA